MQTTLSRQKGSQEEVRPVASSMTPAPPGLTAVGPYYSIATYYSYIGWMMARNRALGAATVAILRSVREGHRFGLDIMDATGLPSGTVYPTLARMEDRAFVESEWEDAGTAKDEGRPRRRYYRLTPEGARALSEALERLGLIAGASPRRAEPA